MGSFGGTYFRPIYSSVTKYNHTGAEKEYSHWWNVDGVPIPDKMLTTPWKKYDTSINRYKKMAGTTLEDWEGQSWITKYDPYGWFQWYCRFYKRKIEDGELLADSKKDKAAHQEDLRQLGRWQRFTGSTTKENAVGRWKSRLINMMKDKYLKGGMSVDDILEDRSAISPVIRQSLQHWGYMITRKDLQDAIGKLLFSKDL